MNGLLKYSFPICFSLLALFACEDDGIDVDNIEVPAGFALSAGTATNFLTSSYAYDRSADWIQGHTINVSPVVTNCMMISAPVVME